MLSEGLVWCPRFSTDLLDFSAVVSFQVPDVEHWWALYAARMRNSTSSIRLPNRTSDLNCRPQWLHSEHNFRPRHLEVFEMKVTFLRNHGLLLPKIETTGLGRREPRELAFRGALRV